MLGITRVAIGLASIAVACIVPGCGRERPEPGVLRLLSFRQAGQAGVFLNETLVLHFDSELERSSVTGTSLSVVTEEGTPARGRLEVQGTKVFFKPDAPLSPDFMDGGLLPGLRYRVIILGFPNPDGLRGRDGEPLSRTHVLHFDTTDAANDSGPRFEDQSPDRSEPLRLKSQKLGPFEPIRLICDEPIDPSTLFSEDFSLYEYGEDAPQVSLRATLRSNGEEGAEIELRSVDAENRLRALPVGELWLWSERNRLKDLGGHLVQPIWSHEPRAGILTVVEPQDGNRVGSYQEDFLDDRRRSPALLEGFVGTAYWNDGTVGIRFPAAAGDGSDGAVSLTGEESRSEIRATDLTVARGEVVRLTGPGLVVLQSQGRVTIEGSLRRDVEGKQRQAEELGILEYSEWHRWVDEREEWKVTEMSFDEGESLSRWLQRARALDLPWTVIIAGGELIVRGDIWADGPLLLVSGGWIRVNGEIRDRPRQFWTLGHPLSSRTTASPRMAPLVMDAPRFNPLAESLTWSVLSAPFRPPGGLEHWLPARVMSQARGGSIRISYIGERDSAGSVEVVGPVDSPVLLEDCEAIRIQIELSAGPQPNNPLWDPPLVDAVELSWEQPEPRR